jgi:hypothetical protein
MEAKDTISGNTIINRFGFSISIKDELETQAGVAFKAGREQGYVEGVFGIIEETMRAKKEGIREVLSLAKKLLEMAEHGDYSNGVEAFGLDEGRVRASELLKEYEKELEELEEKVK